MHVQTDPLFPTASAVKFRDGRVLKFRDGRVLKFRDGRVQAQPLPEGAAHPVGIPSAQLPRAE
jgi:hypothetical protein